MDSPCPVSAEGVANNPPARCIWPWILVGLLTWQGWMTWCLLEGRTIFDNRPVLSGFHPQHLYLGTLGARSMHATGGSCCYDTAFQIGYPKTPVFNGSRLAEVFLFVAGATYQPVAYKIGLALLCLAIPCLLILAARGAGLDWPVTTLAVAAGLWVWWSPCSYDALAAGSCELHLGALAALANVGLLLRFHKKPGVLSWLGLVFTASLGWFAQPMLFPIALPLFLMFYLHVGHQHASLSWHLFLLLGEVLSLALNATWLMDWASFWWLRSTLPVAGGILSHRTLQTVWNAPLWGSAADRTFGLFLLLSALVGVLILPRNQRAAARLLGLGTGGLFLLALLGISWEPLGSLGTAGLLAPALWFASLPAAHAWTQSFYLLGRMLGSNQRAGFTLFVLAGILVGMTHDTLFPLVGRLQGPQPLQYSLGPDREALVEAINNYTGSEARILWEDIPLPRTAPHWAPLLPFLTQRNYVGGLDPDGTIEHATIGFLNQNLAGLHISRWTDGALEEYCTQYNIGWVICFSPSAMKRFSDWKGAEKTVPVKDETEGFLFTIKRSSPGFALKGQAQLVHADSHHITLANVVPDQGVVVLSLHYQAGLRASPSRVHVEREPVALDPIGFLRLRVAGPVARVTLTWGDR
jgi:hypothetical protein